MAPMNESILTQIEEIQEDILCKPIRSVQQILGWMISEHTILAKKFNKCSKYRGRLIVINYQNTYMSCGCHLRRYLMLPSASILLANIWLCKWTVSPGVLIFPKVLFCVKVRRLC